MKHLVLHNKHTLLLRKHTIGFFPLKKGWERVAIATYFYHRASSFSASSDRNSCLSYLCVERKLSLNRGSVCLPAVTASPCSLNSEVLLSPQAWFTAGLSRHFRGVRRRQPSHSKNCPFFFFFCDFWTF